MRPALIIAAKDLRERLRDRSAIVLAIIAPFGLAAIFSQVLPSTGNELHVDYAVVDLDGSEISAAFLTGPMTAIEDAGIASVVVLDDEEAARTSVDAGDADAAVVIPAGFGEAVTTGAASGMTIIGDTNAGLAIEILRSLAEGFRGELDAVRLSVATVIAAEGAPPNPDRLADLARRAAEAPSPIGLVDAEAELRQMPTTTFYAASMAIFFLFFTAQFGILSLLSERRQGTLPRLVAAPIPPWAIVAGKAFGAFALGIVAMTVLVAASSVLLGARWGDPIGVAALVVAAVIAAMGITALITTLARTEEQAGGWNAIVAVTLGILGGSFFDLSQAPEFLSRLSFITPHAWFLAGLDQLAAPSFVLADLALPIGALLAFGVITGGIGLLRASSLVVPR
jgi:ABC-2 type transport system permease protein